MWSRVRSARRGRSRSVRRVVQRAGAVEKDQGSAVDPERHQLSRTLCHSKQQDGPRAREQEADQMGGAVDRLSNVHGGIVRLWAMAIGSAWSNGVRYTQCRSPGHSPPCLVARRMLT